MEEILKTTLLEFDKSAFLIDLVKHNSGKQYIRIIQTISAEQSIYSRTIQINPTILTDLLSVLDSYNQLIPGGEKRQTTEKPSLKRMRGRTFTEDQKAAIQNRYLKGVSIADLSLQFDCKSELIEQVLYNSGIAIVDNTLPERYQVKKGRRK